MKYSNYIMPQIKVSGALHLSGEQFIRLQNIFYAEWELKVIKDIGVKTRTVMNKESRDKKILERLTRNLEPGELLEEMYKLSM